MTPAVPAAGSCLRQCENAVKCWEIRQSKSLHIPVPDNPAFRTQDKHGRGLYRRLCVSVFRPTRLPPDYLAEDGNRSRTSAAWPPHAEMGQRWRVGPVQGGTGTCQAGFSWLVLRVDPETRHLQ